MVVMREILEEIFDKVREYALTEGIYAYEVLRNNPEKKDETKKFDYTAEQIIIDELERTGTSLKILTEERGEVKIGDIPEYTVIIDPIDGSTNFKFGLESSGFSIAFIKGDVGSDELNFDDISVAFIGNIFTGTYWYAKKGEGGVRVRRYLGKKIKE